MKRGEALKDPNRAPNLWLLRVDTKCDDRFTEIFAVSLRRGSRNLISSSVCMILIEVIEKRGERFAREEECRRLRADDWWDISVMRVLS